MSKETEAEYQRLRTALVFRWKRSTLPARIVFS